MSETQENKPQSNKPQGLNVSEYTISWSWLFGGLLVLLLAGSSLLGLYYVRSAGMASHILAVVQKMSAESETLKADGNLKDSLQKRRDAANLLNNFNQTHQGIFEVQKELNTVLESLYVDEGKMAGPLGAVRSKQIMDNCNQLIQTVASDKESLPYKIRLMELEWDRRNLAEVLDRAKEVLRVERAVNDRENYDALRMITLTALSRLTTERYNPASFGSSFPERMDQLLDKVYRMKPDDIEIAAQYAAFIIDVNNPLFRQNASEKLLGTSEEERRQTAVSIIDDMVSRNADKTDAYLTRFRFRARYTPSPMLPDDIDPDLLAVLKIEPGNPETLILAGMYAIQQSVIAQQQGDKEKSEERKKIGEEYLRRNVKENPRYGLAYQYLGDYLAGGGNLAEAVQIWKKGVSDSNHPAAEELVGRLVTVSIELKQFEQAQAAVSLLNQITMEARLRRPGAVAQIRNMSTLLIARLLASEGAEARSKAEEAQVAGKMEESRRLFATAQKQTSDALQMLEGLLGSFGSTFDYVISKQSIYERLLPESLILAGQLTADQNKWDRAARYFEVAAPFERVRERAVVLAANAYQQCNQPEKGVNLLAEAAARNQKNLSLVYAYTRTLFRYQMGRNENDPRALDLVEKNLNYLNEHRDELPAPWMVDIRLVHLKLARASMTNSPEKMLNAQVTATKEFRALEDKEFPKPKDGKEPEKKIYSDDLGFLTELAGIYSSLAALSDFDRVLARMRELPGGENAYFGERLNDALGRNDKEGAILIIDEAVGSNSLTATQKQRFLSIMQNLKSDQPNSLDKVYETLKKSYDQNPDSLKPQAFFLLANMAVDRGDFSYAKVLQGRLEKIEGAPERGTWWRYIEARILLSEQVPQYDRCRQIQEEIITFRPDWDMAYALRASIEEKFFMANPDNADAKAKIIESLQSAIRCGNTQPAIWNRLLSLYEADQRTEDAKKLRTDAMVRAIALDSSTGQFPQPYQRMYTQVYKYIQDSDPQNADITAKQCIALAEGRREDPNLIFALNLALGKMFFDAELLENAKRYLEYVAKRGASYVFPLAVCIAKNKQVDEGFALILDEIDRTPSSQPVLLPSLLVLLAQVRPSEEIFNRIDKLMIRIETGERQVLRGNVEEADKEGVFLPLGTKRLRSLLVRFPDNAETPKADDLEIFPEEEEAAPANPPVPKPAVPAEENKTEEKE